MEFNGTRKVIIPSQNTQTIHNMFIVMEFYAYYAITKQYKDAKYDYLMVIMMVDFIVDFR